jgi:phenylalanyl-tRNA synthetase alpha chain
VSVVTISPARLATALALRDLSDPAAGPHAMQLVVASLVDVLRTAWGCPVCVHRAHPVVSVRDNYERLRYPADAVTRDARYTRYVSATSVLRTHTTAMIPPLLDHLAMKGQPTDVVLAPLGLVYRRDTIDRLHVSEPHQLDLWRIRRDHLDTADLECMIALVAGALAPGAPYRTNPAAHPYTLQGREIEVYLQGRWVEVGECGLAHPAVLRDAGLDPARWSGLAMGLGLDRAVMLRKGIEDIRLLRASDPRIADQMLDLLPYRPVSALPPVRRDLSIAAAPGTDAEALGDKVREALGPRAGVIEDLTIVAETPMEVLPSQAVARIGIRPGQVNLLVRLVLRHPSQTLTDADANALRDDVYALVHEGTTHQWCCRPGR